MAQPYTREWWLDRLILRLGAKQRRYDLLDSYVRSNPPMPPRPDKGDSNAAFEFLRRISRVNWADIIVESVVERQTLLQFVGPDEAQQVWTANGLSTQLPQVLRTKGTLGEAYSIVGDSIDPALGVPRVTFEDPRQVIAEVDPIDKSTVRAALKVFTDDAAGVDLAYLWLRTEGPAVLHKALRPIPRADRLSTTPHRLTFTADRWEWQEPETLSTAEVPVVWWPNRADLYGRTMGEFEHVLDDLDRINLLVLQRVQVAVLQAFRQRAVKGNLPEKDEHGNPIDYNVLLAADPGALWQLPSGVELWESSGVDLTPILESVKGDVRDVAGRTRTPLYYFYPDAATGSAEGAATQREGLVFRANSRMAETSGPIAQTMTLALAAMGQEAAVQPVWLRPDLATVSERYDAAAKAISAGVPWRTVMVDVLQFTPEQVATMEEDGTGPGPGPSA